MKTGSIRDQSNIALVHEWIDSRAGSEKVFESLAAIYPDADLFALSLEPGVGLDVQGRTIRTTSLDTQFLRRRRHLTLPLMPAAWRAVRSKPYDLVITSHHAFAHTNHLTSNGGRHLVYVHSPARYVWTPDIDQRGGGVMKKPARIALRAVDRRAAQRITSIAANSSAVAERIRRFWQRDAVVIHPPVRTHFFEPRLGDAPARKDFLFAAGRWIPYKNFIRVIEVANFMGIPVKIAGGGPDEQILRNAAAAARVPAEIITRPSDEELRTLYQSARCLIFPTNEDFGIVPVECQAAGTPVVALDQGGAQDTILNHVSGILVPTASVQDLADGVSRASDLSGDDCTRWARKFRPEAFEAQIRSWVESGRVETGNH